METWMIVTLVIVLVVTAALIALYIVGSKMQKKQEKAQADMQVGAQTYSILVIDKKKMKLKEAGFPAIVVEQTPKYLRNSKVPVVKAKIGPKVMSLMCEPKIYDLIPIKKEVKVVMNGIYIIDVKGARGGLAEKPAKLTFMQKIKAKLAKKENV